MEYLAALNFVALITDCQWDSFAAINEAAKIDLAKNKYDNRKSLKKCLSLIIYFIFDNFFDVCNNV